MKRQSIILTLTFVWGVFFANISHADIIKFETEVIVTIPGLGFDVGDILRDELTLDFGTGNRVTDIANVVSFFGDGGLILTPTFVNLIFLNGNLSGVLGAIIPMTEINTLDIWFNGTGALFVTNPGPFGPLVAAGSSVIRQVPEPTTLSLLGLGLLGMAAARRRRKV